LDGRSGELRKSGARVPRRKQQLSLLDASWSAPASSSRATARARLWPGDTFIDCEQGVNAAVSGCARR
jgi:hypothetical protein